MQCPILWHYLVISFFGIRKFWKTFFIHSNPLGHLQNHHPRLVKCLNLFRDHITILVDAFAKMADQQEHFLCTEPPVPLVIVIWFIKKKYPALISCHWAHFSSCFQQSLLKVLYLCIHSSVTSILDQLLLQLCFRLFPMHLLCRPKA